MALLLMKLAGAGGQSSEVAAVASSSSPSFSSDHAANISAAAAASSFVAPETAGAIQRLRVNCERLLSRCETAMSVAMHNARPDLQSASAQPDAHLAHYTTVLKEQASRLQSHHNAYPELISVVEISALHKRIAALSEFVARSVAATPNRGLPPPLPPSDPVLDSLRLRARAERRDRTDLLGLHDARLTHSSLGSMIESAATHRAHTAPVRTTSANVSAMSAAFANASSPALAASTLVSASGPRPARQVRASAAVVAASSSSSSVAVARSSTTVAPAARSVEEIRAKKEAIKQSMEALAAQLKDNAKRIEGAILSDKKTLEETEAAATSNVATLRTDNRRLEEQSASGCGTTWWSFGALLFGVAVFFSMWLFMKIVPKPRYNS